MGRPSKSKNQKKERAAALQHAQQEFGTVPHSFVFHRGRVGKNVRQLIADVRKVMEPYTARALKVRKNNSLKDFVAVAGPLGVTHFLVFSKSSSSINFKLFRLPGGPTLTFKVMQYSLIKDVVSSLKRHRMHEQQFTHHPLLVLSNFGFQQIQVKLMASMFQNMFPSINVHRVNVNSIKRCLLVSYDAETQLLDFRHYSVKVVPVGVSKGLKKLLQEKFPNMSRLEDISELLVKDINLSESEAEQDGTHNVLELPQAYAGRGNMKAQQSAVRLTEIGPRMTLQLIKVEEGLAQGNVLYHGFIHKMEAEVKEILARKEAKLQLKAERRRKQEADVERKRRQREAHRERSLAGIRRKRQQDGDSDAEDPGAPEQQDAAEQSEESDAEYYRQEVGEEPDKDLFPNHTKRKRSSSGAVPLRKRSRQSQPEHPAAPGPRPTAPGKRRKGEPAPRDSRHRGGARQGAAGRKPHRGTERPAREGDGPGSGRATLRPKGRGKLLTKGKTIFRRPGRAKKGNFQESLWPVLAAQFPPAFVGNAMAVYHFVARERSWHSGIVYSFHLAVSGMLYSLSLPFLAAYYYPPKDWRYGAVLCKLERFLFNCNLYGGIFFVTCISLNRYLGIVYPLRVHGRLQPHHAKALSAVVWVLAGVLSAPTFFFSELQEAEGGIECLGSAAPQRLRGFYPYSLLLAGLGCGLPFLLTASCYAAIIRTVFRNPHLSRPEKRKVGMLVGAGVALYAFSYLPYHIFRNLNLGRRLLQPGTEDCAVSRTIHATAQVCKILINLNICLHPLLYATLANSTQSCCSAGCGAGTADGERAEHVELRPAA
ncbi:suppressor of SWI4 1 homolog [Aptenodytes patagonicus]|uniref:suppressor of SWI4 1 homolog n=1 Tax=Aptenodytes patagonicus TaxID=9234 RepID=UPI003F9F1668